MRRFRMDRTEDATGVSGTGCVAQGVVFDDGTVVLRWLTKFRSTAVYATLEEAEAIHLHGGASVFRFEDPCCFACGAHLMASEIKLGNCLACGAGQTDAKGELYYGARPDPKMGRWVKVGTLEPTAPKGKG